MPPLPDRIELVDGYRRGTHFIHAPDGHTYHYNRTMRGGRLSLQCMRYRNYKRRCRGRASINDAGYEFRTTSLHNHTPDHNLLHERRFRAAVLDRCRSGDIAPLQTIYDEERRRLLIPRVAAANVPYAALRSAMQAARSSILPRLPQSLSDLDRILCDPQNQFLTQTLDGLDNVYAGATGSTALGTKCLIFISGRMLRYLERQKKIFSDGTFSIVPRLLDCGQVWNIVTTRRHTVVPIGSILMQTRTIPCYRQAIRAIKTLCPTFRPDCVMCDWEDAEQTSFGLEYPNAQRNGCLFHSCKAILQNAKELGLTPLIRENEIAQVIVRSLSALPLLPSNCIVDGVLEVGEYADRMGLWNELEPLFDYIKRTWLRPSRLPILSVEGCEERTTNCCESYNSRMKAEVKETHPNAYSFISALVRLEDRYIQDLYVLRTGANPRGGRKLHAVVNDARIQGLTTEVRANTISKRTFLRRVSRQIQGVFNNIMEIVNPA